MPLGQQSESAASIPANQPAAESVPARPPLFQTAPSPASMSSAPMLPAAASARSVSRIVAVVNANEITREELGRECILHHGKEVLDTMINKQLIVQECRRQNITITREDVDREIERMAKRFGLPVDQWMKLLKQERNITPEQYANDIIWSTLACAVWLARGWSSLKTSWCDTMRLATAQGRCAA